MRGADDIVERVREATSIADIIGAHVRLRKRGRNYLGLCPFHTEKTPSFNVLDEKGIYKCFGCGEGGDVFSFLMKIEGLTFPETLERLAKAANIEYTPRQAPAQKEQQDHSESLIAACREYAGFCYRALHSEIGKEAMSYIRERKFSEEIIKKFGLGYSPEGQHSFLASKSESASKSLQLFEQAGIILRGTSGDPYDRFHGRLLFPIFSTVGRIIGFGGRLLPSTSGSQQAKYLNSPETSLYRKSEVLYGLFQAKDAIRKQDFAILVEGYADVIALSQAGFENVVAASGTSLTIQQLAVLRRYSRQIVLLFDADTAGKNAALRGIELAIAAEFDVNTIVLPNGEDPDSYIRNHGAEAFADTLARRTSFIEAKTKILRDAGAFETPEGSARAIRSIVETIAKIPDAIKRELFIRKISEKFRLRETILLDELQKMLGINRRQDTALAVREEAKQSAVESNSAPGLHSTIELEPSREERILAKAFIEDAETSYAAAVEIDFNLSLIANEMVRAIIMRAIGVFEETGQSPNVSELLDTFFDDTETTNFILTIAAETIAVSDEWVDAEPSGLEIKKRIRISVLQSCSKITTHSIERELRIVKEQLLGDIDESELEALMKKSIFLSSRLQESRLMLQNSNN